MPTCSVPHCLNATGKDSRITLHPFPHETPLFLKKWIENIGRPNWRPGHRSLVCSEHFEKDDFDRQGRLRIGSFPVKFPEPPSRKKPKLDSSTDSADKSLKVSTKQEILPKATVLLPVLSPSVIKKALARESDPSQHVISVENASSLAEVSSERRTDTVAQENISNEKRIKMKLDQNSSSCTELPKVSLKRKVLEESQPTACSNPGPVLTAYSLRACRICRIAHNSNVSVFGQEGKDLSLLELLKKCHIQVSESQSLPLYVCRQCIPSLKTTYDLLTTWEKTNLAPAVGDVNYSGEPDPPVIHSKPVQPQHASRGNRRVLLLEMCLREGIPVKDMIGQAIQELTLRLKPKASRESKPEGRIMFLDLQGGTDAFPEQMKKAISMLFPSVEKKTTTITLKTTPTKGSQGVQTNAAVLGKSGSSPLSSAKQIPNFQAVNKTPSSSKQVVKIKGSSSPSILKKPEAKTAAQSSSSTSVVTSKPTTLRPIAAKPVGSVSGMTQSLIFQTSPGFSSEPLAVLTSSSGASPAIRIAATGSLPKILPVPSLSYLNVQPNSATLDKSKAMEQSDTDDNIHCYEDAPSIFESGVQSEISEVPPLVSILPTLVPMKQASTEVTSSPSINISKMRDSVVSKINKGTNQIKLGDKIVGIVLRNSDSQSDIHQKLQATFSAKAPPSKDSKPKEKIIKRSVVIGGMESIPPGEVEGEKKLKPKVLDVPSAVDSPTDYSDRRNARRLSLGYVWRKTSFLVSSYQKLFTWDVGSHEKAMPVLTCRVCKFIPKSRQDVEIHLASHPDLQCPICSKYFLKDTKVLEHMSVIHGTPQPVSFVPKKKPPISWRVNPVKRPSLRNYQCSRCYRRFKVRDALERHLTVCKVKPGSGIPSKGPQPCEVCHRSFPTEDMLQEHMNCHVKRTSWLCDICGLVMKSASNYRTHIARHDELAYEYKYQCGSCKKRFKLENRYQEHLKKHEKPEQFICSSCGKSFRSLGGLRQHEILHGERKLQCKFCPSRFHRQDHLRIHERSHLKQKSPRTGVGRASGKTARTFSCRFCISKSSIVKFPNLSDLLKHYSEDHALERGSIPGAKTLNCGQCSKSFSNSTLLRHHLMWHAGLRPYNCSVCRAGFMVKERLRNHELTHTNERPYKCHDCGKGFRSKHVLKQHKLIHNDPSKFFKCQYCVKTFSRIDNLRTHTRVHTGEKPWRCLRCNRQFRLRSDCTKHIQISHSVPPEEVESCIETLMDPLSAVAESQSAIAAVAAITTVQSMDILIEDVDIGDCGEVSLQ